MGIWLYPHIKCTWSNDRLLLNTINDEVYQLILISRNYLWYSFCSDPQFLTHLLPSMDTHVGHDYRIPKVHNLSLDIVAPDLDNENHRIQGTVLDCGKIDLVSGSFHVTTYVLAQGYSGSGSVLILHFYFWQST